MKNNSEEITNDMNTEILLQIRIHKLKKEIETLEELLADVKRTEDKLERICPGCGSKITGTCWECIGDGGLER